MNLHAYYYSIGLVVLVYLALLALSVVMYVLTGISLYQIAKRRGVRCYGLAWVPIGSSWLIGAIGDQYEGIRTGKKQTLRWWILGLLGAALVMGIVVTALLLSLAFKAYTYSEMMTPDHALQLGGSVFAVVLLYMLLISAMIAGNVLTFISLYRLYRSTKPQNAVVFLVLSIVFSVTMPFFLFACRKYDAPIEMVRNPIPPQYLPNEQQPTDDDAPTDTKDTTQQ